MSDVKAEEAPVVVEPPKAAEEVPAVSTAEPITAAEPAKAGESAPAPAEESAAEDSKAEDKKEEPQEVKPVTEGFLELKPPGFLHFIPLANKKYFYLQDEPIAVDHLQVYLKKEKPVAAHANVAWASQTGKGLFFFTKNQDQKAHPTGIIKLADVVEVTISGANKFALKLTHDVLQFESIAAHRDGWVATLKAKVAEAKESVESVTSSEAYKTTLEKLAKPIATAKSPETKDKDAEESKDKEPEAEKKEEDKEKEDKKEKEKEEKKEKVKSDASSSSSSSSDDEGPSDKSEKKGKKVKRSASKKAKRASFFGIMGGKDKKHKEEKKEEKKEEEAKPEETKAEPVGEPSAPVEAAEETKAEEAPKPIEPAAAQEPAPKNKNRHSVFGGFFDKRKEVEKKKDDEVKPEDAKVEPVAEPAPAATEEASKPIDASPAAPVESGSKTPASPPKESLFDKFFKKDKAPAAAPAVAETKKEETAEPKPEEALSGESPKETVETKPEVTTPKEAKRKSSFFTSLGGKKEKKSDVKSDTEDGEPSSKSGPSSPLPKKLGLFRSHSKSAKDAPKEESKGEVPPVPEVAPTVAAVETTPATTEPVAPAPEANPAIGDVVAEAVTVGQTKEVQAAA